MAVTNEYSTLLARRGVPLTSVGSAEVALRRDDAREALLILQRLGIAVLGGDVLRFANDRLQYTRDNWYTDREPGEAIETYRERTWSTTRVVLDRYRRPDDADVLFVFVLITPDISSAGFVVGDGG